jgi:hypothetical protein
MKHTMLCNPLIKPWEELAQITNDTDVAAHQFGVAGYEQTANVQWLAVHVVIACAPKI